VTKVTKIYAWGHQKRYNDFSNHFKILFKERIQKVSVDAGFTCPNRDGLKGIGGCTFCNNKTFNPSYCQLSKSISAQLGEGISFFRRKYDSMKFLAYFQAYTNTYAPVADLERMYSEALSVPDVMGLVVATRPDCLSNDVLDLLQAFAEKYYVMVELGVESCENDTLARINRGHTFEESVAAIEALAARSIHNCAHLILGLPGENRSVILNQARKISALPVENIKLHQLQIHRDTVMAHQYVTHPGQFDIYDSAADFVELIVDYVELLRPSIVIERFVSESPAKLLIAPDWGIKNFEFVAKVEKRLAERDTWQGRLYQP